MTMIGGSVTVDDSETHAGDGLARVMYERLKADLGKNLPVFVDADGDDKDDETTLTKEQLTKIRLGSLRFYASLANALGPATVDYIHQNATVSLTGMVATINTSTSAGRVPDPATPGAALTPPAVDVKLPVTAPNGGAGLSIK